MSAMKKRSVIHLFSSPRCTSTSLMYSFAARNDCVVWDEPFFAQYLLFKGKAFQATRPLSIETIAKHTLTLAEINERLENAEAEIAQKLDYEFLFAKHICTLNPVIAEQSLRTYLGFSNSAVRHCAFILVREPVRIMASYRRGLRGADVSLDDIGLREQLALAKLYSKAVVARGEGEGEGETLPHKMLLLLNEDLMRNPEAALRALCKALSIPFDITQLSWESGARDFDGAWAPAWYTTTHASTGFNAKQQSAVEDSSQWSENMQQQLAEANAIYAELLSYCTLIKVEE